MNSEGKLNYGITTIFWITFLFAFVAACSNPSVDSGRSEKPNVVIIVVDDMGYGDLSATGKSEY